MNTTTEQTKDRILRLLDEGNLAEARPLCQAWLARADTADAWRVLGAIAGREGKLPEAERCFREAVARDPADTKSLSNLAHSLRAQGQLTEAVAAYRAVLSLEGVVVLRFTLADILTDLGDPAAVETEFRNGLASAPIDVSALYNLGCVCQHQGRLKEAREYYGQVLARDPQHAHAMNNLGLLFLVDEEYAKARGLFERVITLQPDLAPAWRNLGKTLIALGHPDKAVTALERSMQLGGDAAEAWSDIGLIRARQGRDKEAAEHFEQALRFTPGAETHIQLSRSRYIEDFPDLALIACERILATDPESPEAHHYKGLALRGLNRLDEAVLSYRQAIILKPDFAEAHYHLGNLHQKNNRLSEAEAYYRRTLAIRPDYARARQALGLVMRDTGRAEEALKWLSHEHALDMRMYTLNYSSAPRETITAAHREWGERWGHTRADLGPPGNNPEPERRLRIAYVSPDLRSHSVAYFIEPVLKHHDKSRFEVFAYAQFRAAKPDRVSERLRGYCDHWIETRDLGDIDLARRIRADGIDILVDLAGHTRDNRLLAFAYRPAPVQISYLGYVSTTGLPAMDYRLTDERADPADSETLYTEQLVRLPQAFFCYQPPHESPPVNALPAKSRGDITFASLNNPTKLNEEVIALWAKILTALPTSRLILQAKAFVDAQTCALFRKRFAKHGIAGKRIEMLPSMNFQEHLAVYHAVDIALDPFPWCGHTVTCHALWMGVPIISLAGDRYAGRLGVSVLENLRLSELIAQSEADYIEKAVGLGKDLDRLAALRAGLRARFQESGLCDGAGFTADLERTYRALWQQWLRPPRPKDVPA